MTATTFRQAVIALRESRHYSQSDLARRIGCVPSHISRIERGTRHPSREVVTAIADLFALDGYDRARLLSLAGYTEVVWSEIAWRVQRMEAA